VAKSQFALIYRKVPPLLLEMRTSAGLTQRQLAARIGKSQSWVFKSEAASRRMDIAEFLQWSLGCGVDPLEAFKKLMKSAYFGPRQPYPPDRNPTRRANDPGRL
jgi:transcriptional regulator with XRE-family HTH domain